MLSSPKNYAKDLIAHTNELKISMQKLLDSSASQISSLKQSAMAIEEINASVQNVNYKTHKTSR